MAAPAAPSHSAVSIERRVAKAHAMLGRCTFCELRCGVDRTRNAPCPCRLGSGTYEYKRYISLNEELELVPSLRVFLSGCNFRCRFCDEAPDCFLPRQGCRVLPARLAEELQAAVDDGVTAISLLGGEASIHTHTILAVAAASSRALPLAVNTNMYMTPEVLDLLDGVIALYLADFKFGNDACAKALAGVPRYMDVVCRNIKRAAATTRMVIRHVLIPGHLDCCLRPIVDWVSANLPGARFQLYTGYVPCWRASGDPKIGRLNSQREVRQAIDYVGAANVCRRSATNRIKRRQLRQNSTGSAEVSITVGADGRLYCHDLTPELASVLRRLSPDDPELTTRLGTGSAFAEAEG